MKALEEKDKTHWTVRRLRRRARTSSLKIAAKKQTAKESKDCDEKDEDTSIPRDDSHSSILEACGISNSGPSKAHVINAEKLVFGATLSKHHVANIEVTFNYVLRFGY